MGLEETIFTLNRRVLTCVYKEYRKGEAASAASPTGGCRSSRGHSPYSELQAEQQRTAGEGSDLLTPPRPLSLSQTTHVGVATGSYGRATTAHLPVDSRDHGRTLTKAVSPKSYYVQPNNLLQLGLER